MDFQMTTTQYWHWTSEIFNEADQKVEAYFMEAVTWLLPNEQSPWLSVFQKEMYLSKIIF